MESNFFISMGFATALGAFPFEISGYLKFSVCLLIIAWLAITISIFRHELFDIKSRNKILRVDVGVSLLIGILIFGIWIGLKPAPPVKEPTFTEGVDEFKVTVGTTNYVEYLYTLQKKKMRFPVADIPAALYVENDKFYLDIEIFNDPDVFESPVRLIHNKLMNKPKNWDWNKDDKALEVVNENMEPVFQFVFESPSHIVIYGKLRTPEKKIYISKENAIYIDADSSPDREDFQLKPIFKYPSEEYEGVRNP